MNAGLNWVIMQGIAMVCFVSFFKFDMYCFKKVHFKC